MPDILEVSLVTEPLFLYPHSIVIAQVFRCVWRKVVGSGHLLNVRDTFVDLPTCITPAKRAGLEGAKIIM